MQKQMVHLGLEVTQRDTDKPLERPGSRTVIIQGESTELYAVCQLFPRFTLVHFQTFTLVDVQYNPGLLLSCALRWSGDNC